MKRICLLALLCVAFLPTNDIGYVPVEPTNQITLHRFSTETTALIRSALYELDTCSPRLSHYVHNLVTDVFFDQDYTVSSNGSIIYLSENGTRGAGINYAPAELRQFWIMVILVHEARHKEQRAAGLPLDENDANRFFPQLALECGQGLDLTPIYFPPH